MSEGTRTTIDRLSKRVEDLEAENERLRADSERLEYLQAIAEKRNCGWNVDDRGDPYRKHWSQEPEFETLREAIDAARDSAEEG